MQKYWVTFRLAPDETYQNRYDAMFEAMIRVRGASWSQSTRFWLVITSL